jgi:hypothetical protein
MEMARRKRSLESTRRRYIDRVEDVMFWRGGYGQESTDANLTWAGEGGREWQEVDLAFQSGGSGKFFSFPPSDEQSPVRENNRLINM